MHPERAGFLLIAHNAFLPPFHHSVAPKRDDPAVQPER
jgi:hypothetical protein